MPKILVVDDEVSITEVLKTFFAADGHDVSTANSGAEALAKLSSDYFDLMVTDLKLPDTDGISLFSKAKDLQAHMQVIMMTAYAGVDTAVEAMRRGAYHYVTKPFKIDELLLVANRAISYSQTLVDNAILRGTRKTRFHFNAIVGESEPMLRIYALIEKVARTKSTALVLGESGTGKELVAKALHSASPRASAPFVAVNCSAMPETLLESELFGYKKGSFTGAYANKRGLFESASGGTLFLDEIGSIPPSIQSKLLRVLQEGEIRPVGGNDTVKVDVRIVAATNEDLTRKIKDGAFREDLYYRLSVIPFVVPPLRERIEDIPLLAAHFLDAFNQFNKRRVSMADGVLEAFAAYSWPGNVRELENLINRLATLCDDDLIRPSDLPSPFSLSANSSARRAECLRKDADAAAGEDPPPATKRPDGCRPMPLKEFIRRAERDYVRAVLAECAGSKEKAAAALGVSLATLYRKLEMKGIQTP